MTSAGLPPEIAAHYGEDSAEEDRLDSGAGRLEFLRTWELLQRHLPPPPARVLDIGGAAGVYTFSLWPPTATTWISSTPSNAM